MINESEPFTGTNVRSHLRALQAQIELLKNSLNEYEDGNRRLRKQITEELITAIVSRFEKNEEKTKKIDEKLDYVNFELREKLSQEIKGVRDELSSIKMIEERVGNMEEKLDSVEFELRERIPQEIMSIRNEISEVQLSKAITSVSQEKEIKVSSKPLDELNKDKELFF